MFGFAPNESVKLRGWRCQRVENRSKRRWTHDIRIGEIQPTTLKS